METNDDPLAQNCFVVKDLPFCDQTAYAVPGNPNIEGFSNDTTLGAFYDNYAQKMYDNFEKVLAQIQCQTDSTQRYSLVKTCDDCRGAYKAWLCMVAIPRCEDFSTEDSRFHARNVGQPFPDGTRLPQDIIAKFPGVAFNQSRNPLIDQTLQPGPYKEILPCEDLCYNLVQSCPAAMGFSCPRPGDISFGASYGIRDPVSNSLSCNSPGAVLKASYAPPKLLAPSASLLISTLLAALLVGRVLA